MATADERLIYEAYKSPGRKGDPKDGMPFPDGRGEMGEKEASVAPDTQVLEGIHCTCDVCEHYVAGDRCGAPEGISLSKIPSEDYGAVVICETFTAKNEEPEPGSREYYDRMDIDDLDHWQNTGERPYGL
tara:strand:- start:181 stop:570 length:390 start_codon:yes stop_codon:yes gene_type:complete